MQDMTWTHQGLMLDVGRHFIPVEGLKKLIQGAAVCGVNRLHLHFTEDHGWRLQLRKYPVLTEKGSSRGNSIFGDVSETENNNGFYTREEMQGIVEFARNLGIEIIPEIEIPGHESALLHAMPELGCRRMLWNVAEKEIQDHPRAYRVETTPGVFPNLICPGRDENLQTLYGILDEIMEIFPYPMVHIGGDEAVKVHWRRCPDCQKRMAEEGLHNEEELQDWLIRKVAAYLAEHGRQVIAWNDVLAGGTLPDHFVIQHWWGQDERTGEYLRRGGKVIVSDAGRFYLSRSYAGMDIRTIYETKELPAYIRGAEGQVLGFECCLWTERVTNPERAACMLFPRLCAWDVRLHGDRDMSWEEFLEKVRERMDRIRALGIQGAPEAEWVLSSEAREAAQKKEEAGRFSEKCMPNIRREEKLLHVEKVEKLMRTLDIPEPFLVQVGDWMLEGRGDGGDGVRDMAEQLTTALKNRWEGPWKDVPEKIWLDTLGCYRRFIREFRDCYGYDGFDRGFWTTRQVTAKLFRLGELEYEIGEDSGENDETKKGEKFLRLHIPSDACLEADRMNDSVRQARAFLARFAPEYAQLPITCESWLLSPKLRPLLKNDSRILHFQNAFDITDIREEGNPLLWVYRIGPRQEKDLDPRTLPERTSLQRALKEMICRGGICGNGIGTLVRPFE